MVSKWDHLLVVGGGEVMMTSVTENNSNYRRHHSKTHSPNITHNVVLSPVLSGITQQ